jgi:ABC-2 type transport system permease protein
MRAIYKRELRSYAVSMTGAIAIAVALLITGLMFRNYNLSTYHLLTFSYTLNNSSLVFYIVVPILSMRVFAEERKLKTDQLLLTAPVSVGQIVMGKYLALITVFAIPCVITGFYPLIMLRFGKETIKWDYSALLAYFLMGCAYLAIGMFISSTTENVIIAAILSILFVFVTQMISNTYTLMSASNFAALIFLVILAVLAGFLVYFMTKNYWAAMITISGLSAAWLITYAIKASWFSGKTEAVMKVLDFATHFNDFANGSFTIPNLLYFISAGAIGIILTIQSVLKRRWS